MNDDAIMLALGRMEAKQDAIKALMEDHIRRDDIMHASLDERVTALEQTKVWVMGAAAVVSVGIGALWHWVTK